jgi:hypothetical protein
MSPAGTISSFGPVEGGGVAGAVNSSFGPGEGSGAAGTVNKAGGKGSADGTAAMLVAALATAFVAGML